MDDRYAPDVEGAVKAWLKGVSYVNTYFGGRIGLRFGSDVENPHLSLQEIDFGEDASTAPLYSSLIQLDVWGNVRDRASATIGRNHVARAVRNLTHRTQVAGTDVALHGATLVGSRYLPDPSDEQPRYAMTVRFVASSTAAP